MTKETEGGSVNVDVGLSARAEVHANIDVEVPPVAAGRFLDTLTDVLRPFSEGALLISDHVRLQRIDVLKKIAIRSRELLEAEGRIPSPVPNKVLVPLLEKASLEEPDSELLETWATLLATASERRDSLLPRMIGILAELDGAHVKFLRDICTSDRNGGGGKQLLSAPYGIEVNVEQRAAWDIVRTFGPPYGPPETQMRDGFQNLMSNYIRSYEKPGLLITHAQASRVSDDQLGWSGVSEVRVHPLYEGAGRSYEIRESLLESLNLARVNSISYGDAATSVDIRYIHLTRLGVELCMACDTSVRRGVQLDLALEC